MALKNFLLITPTTGGLRIDAQSNNSTELYKKLDFFKSQFVIKSVDYEQEKKNYEPLKI